MYLAVSRLAGLGSCDGSGTHSAGERGCRGTWRIEGCTGPWRAEGTWSREAIGLLFVQNKLNQGRSRQQRWQQSWPEGDGSGRSSIARGGGRRRCNRRWAHASNLLKPVAGGRRGPVPASSKRRQADGLGARAAARRRWWWSAAGSGHRACGDNDDEQRRAEKQPSGDGAEASMASDPRRRRWPDPGQLGLGRRGSRPVAGLGAGEVEVAGSRGYDAAGLRPSTALVAGTVDGGGERRVGDEAGREDEAEEELQRSGWRWWWRRHGCEARARATGRRGSTRTRCRCGMRERARGGREVDRERLALPSPCVTALGREMGIEQEALPWR